MGLTESAVGIDLVALYDQDQDESREADEPGTGRGSRQKDMPDAHPRFTDPDAAPAQVEVVVATAEPDEGDDDDGDEFDPAEHNVDDVLAYLADADDAERNRVLGDERAGKNRKGIVGDD